MNDVNAGDYLTGNYSSIFSSKPYTNSLNDFFEIVEYGKFKVPVSIYLNSIGYVTNETQYFTKESAVEFLQFHPEFNEWVNGVNTFGVTKIYVLQIQPTFFDKKKEISNGFVFVKYVKNDNSYGVALIRGNANAYFVILNVNSQKYVVFSKKTQIPGLQKDYLELIAGNNLDSNGVLTRLEIQTSTTNPTPTKLVDMYPSIGGCNECISIFKLELDVKPEILYKLNKQQQISVIPYFDVVQQINNGEITDSKILSAFVKLKLKIQKLVENMRGGSKRYTRRKIRKSKKIINLNMNYPFA